MIGEAACWAPRRLSSMTRGSCRSCPPRPRPRHGSGRRGRGRATPGPRGRSAQVPGEAARRPGLHCASSATTHRGRAATDWASPGTTRGRRYDGAVREQGARMETTDDDTLYLDPAAVQRAVHCAVAAPVLGGQCQADQRSHRPVDAQQRVGEREQRGRPGSQTVEEGVDGLGSEGRGDTEREPVVLPAGWNPRPVRSAGPSPSRSGALHRPRGSRCRRGGSPRPGRWPVRRWLRAGS